MKTLLTFSILISTVFCFSYMAKGEIPTDLDIVCTKAEVDTIYIPILREVVDWPDDMIRPYAIELCQLTKQKAALQKSINKKAEDTRSGNWRICKEVIPGNPNPTDAECKIAYNTKVNNIIDSCIDLISLGHNPHNVLLIIDPLKVEVSCLKGTNIMLQ